MNKRSKFMLILAILLLLNLVSPLNTGISNVSAGGYCDWVQFVADVTVPDGWPVSPGQVLNKTWQLKNIGTCWWSKSYKLVFVGGAQMGGVSEMNLSKDVAPGQTIDLTIGLTAPSVPGRYIGYWKLQNPNGGLFGMGQTATQAFFVEVEVVSSAVPVYDFVANAPSARWVTEASGRRPFPGVYGDPDGFVQVVAQPVLETGIPSKGAGILMAPPAEYDEHIYGLFPSYKVKDGDRFQALVGCEYGSTGCDVRFVLQYSDPSGGNTRSYWNLDKTYKNSFTPVDIKLGSLVGQEVSFVLLIRPLGSTKDDHAIWVNPVIVNSNQTGPEIPTVTSVPLTPVQTVESTLPSSTLCDRAWFLGDVTVPDGTVFAPGETFTKTWRLRNVGDCTWTTDYSLVFSTGDQMGAIASIKLPASVAPREEIDLSVDLVAPQNPGSYRGNWLLKNAAGELFGIGVQWNTLANKPFWLAIDVASKSPPSSENGYDFVAHVCDAQWTSGISVLPLLPCPYQDVSNGTIMVVDNPHLENDTIDTRPALLTVPQNIYNGYIQGVFPQFTVQSGDRFRSLINCEFGQRSCYVVYRLDYQVDNGPIQNFWSFGERYEGLYYQADVDLSPLAGQTVKFILRADANGFPTGDRALWVAPSIVRSAGTYPTATIIPNTAIPTSTPTPTSGPIEPTATLTPIPESEPTSTPLPTEPAPTLQPSPIVPTATSVSAAAHGYINTKYGFQFLFPPKSTLIILSDNRARVTHQFEPGTTLVAKYLDLVVVDGLNPCRTTSFTNQPTSTSNTNINGITFLVETGTDTAFNTTYVWRAYSTSYNNACISMNFVLQSTDNNAPPYDAIPEASLFEAIMATFKLTNP